MSSGIKFHFFAHSWVSDWNHGNAHFLRGLSRSLERKGHKVRCYEQLGGWSLSNMVHQEGEQAVDAIDTFRREFPELNIQFYNNDDTFPHFAAQHLREADVVVIHEWNEPRVVNNILELKRKYGFKAIFHDTHHRAYTSPRDILKFRLDLFDGVLAFGEAIRKIYKDGFGITKTWTFHEAADIEKFRPLSLPKDIDMVWVGNWGDEERTKELTEFLISPAMLEPKRKTVVHGVRYPESALELLREAGIEYRGYLPNLSAPRVYGSSKLALHVPRRQYANGLSGIPTIRVFETLSCGIPLVCSPWEDVENLFRPGEDYICVENGEAMKAAIEHLLKDDKAREQISASGMEMIRKRHTCDHRAQQLVDICQELNV
jgi:spore maturation protein CgeB